jgi:hypothetical protein
MMHEWRPGLAAFALELRRCCAVSSGERLERAVMSKRLQAKLSARRIGLATPGLFNLAWIILSLAFLAHLPAVASSLPGGLRFDAQQTKLRLWQHYRGPWQWQRRQQGVSPILLTTIQVSQQGCSIDGALVGADEIRNHLMLLFQQSRHTIDPSITFIWIRAEVDARYGDVLPALSAVTAAAERYGFPLENILLGVPEPEQIPTFF